MLCTCMARCEKRPEDDARYVGAGTTDDCEPPMRFWVST